VDKLGEKKGQEVIGKTIRFYGKEVGKAVK
jgi:hypothetical protein